MHFLLAERQGLARKTLSILLTRSGHTADVPADIDEAIALAAAKPFDVAIVDPEFTPGDHFRLVRALREVHRVPRIYVVAHLTALDPEMLAEAWSAGADDVISRAVADDELIGRASGLIRTTLWAQPGPDGKALTAGTLREALNLKEVCRSELSAVLGLDLEDCDASRVEMSSEISIVLPLEGLGIRLAIGLATDSFEPLSQHLFQSPSADELIDDALKEFASCVGGAIKRAAFADKRFLGMGLPSAGSGIDPGEGEVIWGFRAAGLAFSVRCLTRAIQTRILPVEDLREQMLVAQEVKAPTGDVLAGLASTLTASTIGRLQSVLRSAQLVRAMNSAMNTPISTKLP
ncbi:MAG: response regulator transcription factor [Myxococcales bacterium]|nr:response regulator transcription factor [Myxococcales bacterium]